MIDLHCHALPGVDDGPATVADALALARAQRDAGVRTVVATPHVHHDYPATTAASIAVAVGALRVELAAAAIGLELLAGAEVSLLRALELPDEELEALRLGGGPWLLVEPPFGPTAVPALEGMLAALQERGHRPLLAHPERCAAFHRDPDLLRRCVSAGMLASVTAGSLVGRFGRDVARAATQFVRAGLVHDIASDAHGAGPRRPPGLLDEVRDAGFRDQAERLCDTAPRAILEGTRVPVAPVVAPAGGGLRRLLRRA